jgi:hypothetical protein
MMQRQQNVKSRSFCYSANSVFGLYVKSVPSDLSMTLCLVSLFKGGFSAALPNQFRLGGFLFIMKW